jgi:hypothetical protein
MKTIHKFSVPLTDSAVVTMPHCPKILSCQLQFGSPVVWAEVNTDSPKTDHKFMWYGTGHKVEEGALEFVAKKVL